MHADAHTHLAMPAFSDDLGAVLQRAGAAGVGHIMTCATSLEDARANLDLARAHSGDGLIASVGFHPHEARRWDGDSERRLADLIREDGVHAIGEVGLDFHYNLSPPDTQREVLRRQIALARSVGLPLVIHCREARDDLRAILVQEKAREAGGMLHCFTGDPGFARFCLDEGFHISFSGIVTFRNAERIREAAKIVPLDRLLVETDSPYLAPAPQRGGRNEPARVVDVARFVAALREIPVEELAEATVENFRGLFRTAR